MNKHTTRIYCYKRKIFLWALSVLTAIAVSVTKLFPEESAADLNAYYRFPFSLGLEYQSYSYFGENKSSNDIITMVLNMRWPVSSFPELQPALELGFVNVDNLDPDNPGRWDHGQYQALVGVVYANHFIKNFEYGLDFALGAGYQLFPNLVQENQTFASVSLIGQAGLYVSLVPSYNFMIAVHPLVKYFHSLTPQKKYDGPVIGAGLSIYYRFGDDPDLPRTPLNSLYLEDIDLPPVYANMHHYYTNHPLGKLRLTNSEKYTVRNIEVYFSQKTYLDAKTYCGRQAELKPGQSWEVELYAIFNNQIFDIEGSEPINGEITATYEALGRSHEQRKSVSFELFDKTTITWDDYHKVAALITPADSALKNYTGFIQRNCESAVMKNFNKNLQLAMQLYAGLTELNVVYQPDPVLPFSTIKTREHAAQDTVYLARDTLKRGSGDCDDLTVLFCSLLESAGIESGYIIVPGHILPAFNTGLEARSFAELHPDREMTIQYNDELWLPIEITLLGKSDFLSAWRKGLEQYRKNTESHGFYVTNKAQELYRPVSLREKDLGLQYGNIEKIRQEFTGNLEQAIGTVLSGYEYIVSKKADKDSLNTLGYMYGSFGRLNEAENTFKNVLALDADYLYAKINLGIILIQKKDYASALDWLQASAGQFSSGKYPELLLVKIYTYISQCYAALKDEQTARQFKEQANTLSRTALALGWIERETLNAAEADSYSLVREEEFILTR